MDIRTITPHELAAVRTLCFTAFEDDIDGTGNPQASAHQILHTPLTRMHQNYLATWAAFDDSGNPIATVAHCTQTAHFDGSHVPLEAIGDVASLPQAHGTGTVRRLFQEILQLAYEQEIPFSYLYPFSDGYYARLGYSCCVKNHIWHLVLSQLPSFSFSGECRPFFTGQDMERDLEQIYNQAVQPYNLSLIREQPEWNRQLKRLDPFRDSYFTYLYYDQNNVPTGYLSYQVHKASRRLECKQFFFVQSDALQGMLAFLKGKQSYYHTVDIPLPCDVPLDLLLTEFHLNSPHNTCYTLEMHGMVRIVHLAAAFRAARFNGSGKFVFSVLDPLLEKNNGIFELIYKDGCFVSLVSCEKVPCIQLTIPLLARFLCAGVRESDLQFLPSCPPQTVELLKKVFPPKVTGIFDYF